MALQQHRSQQTRFDSSSWCFFLTVQKWPTLKLGFKKTKRFMSVAVLLWLQDADLGLGMLSASGRLSLSWVSMLPHGLQHSISLSSMAAAVPNSCLQTTLGVASSGGPLNSPRSIRASPTFNWWTVWLPFTSNFSVIGVSWWRSDTPKKHKRHGTWKYTPPKFYI